VSIAAGKKVGVVGKSGSGKSTLCRLLSRLYSPLAGEVTVNGVDVMHLELSRTISMMEQETLLFDDSVLGRDLHSSTSQLNLKPFLTQNKP
jgi:ATP-binding cassette subfamily B protein